MKNDEERICIECGVKIPDSRNKRAITCSKICSNKRATTPSDKRKKNIKGSLRLATVFSGIGAIEHALKRMNIPTKISFACDTDKYCKEAYLANHNLNEEDWIEDIHDVDGKKFKGKVDLLVGGSPCQSFSMVGKRKGSIKYLHNAKSGKKDEFYTILSDIEKELRHYKKHFKNKVVFCNCDDPRVSNFFHYFSYNFKQLGLKKLITTCYKNQDMNSFSENKSEKGLSLEYLEDKNKNNIPDPKEIEVKYLEGDGDFRSEECIELLKQADIVVTNPPFSLFREYVGQLIEYKKKFLIIGNINAITYKEIFKLIKENKAWLGIGLGRGISGFIVPKHYKLYGTETKIDKNGNRIISPNNCLWLTNLDNSKRHKDINLTKIYTGNENLYPKYDNYEGINVNKTKDIPLDYKGAMGVPITFLHKFNPSQFEIIKFRKGSDEKDLSINGKCPYFRILIKNKRL